MTAPNERTEERTGYKPVLPKRGLILGGVALLGLGALVLAEMREADAPVGPQALLNFLADTQREASRIPMRVTRLSDEEEIRVGNQIAARYLGSMGGTAAAAGREAYVRTIGERIAIRARRKLPYRFHYVSDPGFINAFALPGGHVFLGEGLLRRMRSEDELAAVLGHEIEHIDLYHCAERAQVEAATRKIPLGGLVALPLMVWQAGYSKTQELEADREGVRLSVRAGYSPYGAITLFETMDRVREEHVERARTPQEELSQVAMETLRGYFRSHPLPAERIQEIRELIAQAGWEAMSKQKPLEAPPATPAAEPAEVQPGRMERRR